jgi:hypothetical protein
MMKVLIFMRVSKMPRKATTNINFVMPVCLSAWNCSAPTERIFEMFCSGNFC